MDTLLARDIPRLFLSVVLYSLVFVVPVTAQGIPPGSASTDTGFGGGGSIGGVILLPDGGRALRRISVRLQSMTKGDRITTSDEYGNFVFRGVPRGDYTLVIDKEKEFEPFVQTVSMIQAFGPPPHYNLSVRLTLKSGRTTTPGVINAELARMPKRAQDIFNKALELAKTGDTSAAIQELQSVIAEYPEFMLAYNEMGVLYLKLNELQKADDALQAATKDEPWHRPGDAKALRGGGDFASRSRKGEAGSRRWALLPGTGRREPWKF